MNREKAIRCQVYCQKGKSITAEISGDTGIYEKEGIRIEVREKAVEGCRLGEIRLDMENESCRENDNLRMERPVCVYLPMEERPEKITAMYLYNEWWTRPAFVKGFQEIPDKTQVAFFQYKDRVACLVPMVGREFKSYLTNGTETEICLEMVSGLGGRKSMEEPLYVMAEGLTVEEAVHKVFSWLAEYKGIRMGKDRRVPEMFQYLGWRSWDAFYKEVSQENILKKAEELREKKVPVRWMLIDDGWMTAQGELLADYKPDKEKFPQGFKKMTEEIKAKGDVKWFGVWHALGGYWGGVLPGSDLDKEEHPYLYETVNGKLVPSPFTGERFYRDWYRELRREGIDFVKVDGQSAVPYYFENSLPLCQAARGMNEALESGSSYMDGAVINCMGMAMENILARPSSAVSRNSDDFVPDKEGGFAEHLLQNAYNALYHNEIYCCDWDMFWTVHKDGVKHGLLRAISGGPMYVSDKVGATNPDVLKPLIYRDGRVLMMERSARPTQDCIFSDPMAGGVLKLHNTAPWGSDGKGGGIAVYNLTRQRQVFDFKPGDISALETAKEYWVFDYFKKKVFSLGRNDRYEGTVEGDGFAWFVVLPKKGPGSCLGLMDKYVGFTAVESVYQDGNTQVVIVRETGTVGWMAGKVPGKVMVNGADVTNEVEHGDGLYMVRVPEDDCKMVVSIIW